MGMWAKTKFPSRVVVYTLHEIKRKILPFCLSRYDFKVTEEEISELVEDFGGEMMIPERFETMVDPYHPSQGPADSRLAPPPRICIDPQTTLLCKMLDITDPNTYFTESKPILTSSLSNTSNPAEIQLESSSSEDEEEEDSDSESTNPKYDTFIISHDSSSTALSTSKIDESLEDDEKFVSALGSLRESSLLEKSQEEEEEEESASGVAEMSATSDDGGVSPPAGMLSPPTTSSDEQIGSSSERDSSAYLSPIVHKGEDCSPKRPLDGEEEEPKTDLAQTLFTDKPTEAAESRPKKFKRRNQSIYSTPEHHWH